MIKILIRWILFTVILCMNFLIVTACGASTPTSQPTAPQKSIASCKATQDDGISPSYKPDAPVRNIVGHGHILTGVVLSSRDCTPIANAKLEFWPEVEEKGHPDEQRATFYTDDQGRYRFESDIPDHIHMRISADGYKTIDNNQYHPEGRTEGVFDIVLRPLE
jgi:protocatechuate 3,4-dioxygenase beta subunit